MKKSLIYIIIIIVSTLMAGCSEDVGKDISATSLGAFETLYPNSTAQWEMQSGYEVAHFRQKNFNAETWFDKKGWVATITNLNYSALPTKIKRGFKNSDYAEWEITDIYKVERLGFENIHSIITERNKVRYDLYFNDDGTLVKTTDITSSQPSSLQYLPQQMPEKVAEKMQERHASCIVYDIVRLKNVTEITFLEKGMVKKSLFHNDGRWINTTYRIRETDIRKSTLKAFRKEMPKSKIIEAALTETVSGRFYTIECESNDVTQTLYVDCSGKIVDK